MVLYVKLKGIKYSFRLLLEGFDYLKSCPKCHSQEIRQRSSTLSRILFSTYILLDFLFFTGEINYQGILALIPIVIPYNYTCLNCNNTFYKAVPQWSLASIIGDNIKLTGYLVGILPSMIVITLLNTFFPYTGLERIAAIPTIIFLNTMLILIGFTITRKLIFAFKSILWVSIILLTVFISIFCYPQEFNPPVIKQILEKINN